MPNFRRNAHTNRDTKIIEALPALAGDVPADSLARWLEAYLGLEATTAASSRKVQRRDLERFLAPMRLEERSDERVRWTPRLSAAFVEALLLYLQIGRGRFTLKVSSPSAIAL